ncbi:hypothetical protein MTO96_035209, partial [Rhipicephalus appendiculatus]
RPPAASSGSTARSYSSTSGSSHRGSGRGSWNPGVSPGPSKYKSPVQRGGSSNRKPAGAASAPPRSTTTLLPKVQANHFKLDLNRQLVVYHYEVTIWWGEDNLSPETEAKLRLASRDKRRILAEFSKAHKIATNIFDGQKCLYSTKKLELNEETKSVHVQREIGKEIDEFYVRIRQVGILRYDSQKNCRKNAQALDIAIRCALSHNREFLGRLLLSKVTNESAPEDQPTTSRSGPPAVRGRHNPHRASHSAKSDHDVQNPGEATYSGILTSVRSGQSDLFVNADTILTSFHEAGPLLTYVEALLGRKLVDDPQLEEADIGYLCKKLRGLKVCVKHLKISQTRKIKQITKEGADEINVHGAQTVAYYFEGKIQKACSSQSTLRRSRKQERQVLLSS